MINEERKNAARNRILGYIEKIRPEIMEKLYVSYTEYEMISGKQHHEYKWSCGFEETNVPICNCSDPKVAKEECECYVCSHIREPYNDDIWKDIFTTMVRGFFESEGFEITEFSLSISTKSLLLSYELRWEDAKVGRALEHRIRTQTVYDELDRLLENFQSSILESFSWEMMESEIINKTAERSMKGLRNADFRFTKQSQLIHKMSINHALKAKKLCRDFFEKKIESLGLKVRTFTIMFQTSRFRDIVIFFGVDW